MSTSDVELLEAWRGGDERAGRELFERHFDSVYRFFRSKVDDAAEDLTQQTFLGCVRGKQVFRGDASFRTYLFTIARNRLYTHIRDRQRRDAAIEVGEQSVADLGLASPTEALAAQQEQKLLLVAMRSLPLDMQIALELHYWENMSATEVATVLEIPSGTVKSRLRRAKEMLRDIMASLALSKPTLESTLGDLEGWAKSLGETLREGAAVSRPVDKGAASPPVIHAGDEEEAP